MDTLSQVLAREPIPPRQLDPKIDTDIETICLKCLEKNPESRYVSTQEMGAELGRYLSGKPILARPVSGFERTRRWCKRNPVIASLSTLFVLSLMLGITISAYFGIQAFTKAKQALKYSNALRKRLEKLPTHKILLCGRVIVPNLALAQAMRRAIAVELGNYGSKTALSMGQVRQKDFFGAAETLTEILRPDSYSS